MALNIIKCGDCGELWDECKCKPSKKEVQEKEGLKANGYELDKSDNEEAL